MASPEELHLEQKKRALQIKEEALSKQADQQHRTEARLKDHQQSVASKERANQLKAQNLIDRETKYQEELKLFSKERQSLMETQQELENASQKPLIFLVPFLLLACILAGYFAYEQINKKEQQFQILEKKKRK